MSSFRLPIRVTPRSSRPRTEWDGQRLHVWVSAPPAEGQANEAVVRIVAERLRVPPSSVGIVRGGRGREKLIEVHGLDAEQAARRLLE